MEFKWDFLVFTGDHVSPSSSRWCASPDSPRSSGSRASASPCGPRPRTTTAPNCSASTPATLSTIVWVLAATLSGVAAILNQTISAGSFAAGRCRCGRAGFLLRALAAAVVGRMENLPTTVVAAARHRHLRAVGLLGLRRSVAHRRRCSSCSSSASSWCNGASWPAPTRAPSGTWAATEEIRDIPSELADVPAVQARPSRRFLDRARRRARCLPVGDVAQPDQPRQRRTRSTASSSSRSSCSPAGAARSASASSASWPSAPPSVGSMTAEVGHGPFLPAILLASMAGAAVAVLLGLPALRIQGLFLAVTTLAFAVAVTTVLLNQRFFGFLLPGDVTRPKLLFIDTEDERAYFYFCVLGLLFALFGGLGPPPEPHRPRAHRHPRQRAHRPGVRHQPRPHPLGHLRHLRLPGRLRRRALRPPAALGAADGVRARAEHPDLPHRRHRRAGVGAGCPHRRRLPRLRLHLLTNQFGQLLASWHRRHVDHAPLPGWPRGAVLRRSRRVPPPHRHARPHLRPEASSATTACSTASRPGLPWRPSSLAAPTATTSRGQVQDRVGASASAARASRAATGGGPDEPRRTARPTARPKNKGNGSSPAVAATAAAGRSFEPRSSPEPFEPTARPAAATRARHSRPSPTVDGTADQTTIAFTLPDDDSPVPVPQITPPSAPGAAERSSRRSNVPHCPRAPARSARTSTNSARRSSPRRARSRRSRCSPASRWSTASTATRSSVLLPEIRNYFGVSLDDRSPC